VATTEGIVVSAQGVVAAGIGDRLEQSVGGFAKMVGISEFGRSVRFFQFTIHRPTRSGMILF
jgi:hypothetical protein